MKDSSITLLKKQLQNLSENLSQGTFSYSSELWTNQKAYKPEEAKDLDDKETKSLFFLRAYITEGLCVGMKVHGHTRWLKIPWNRNNDLFGIFQRNSPEPLNGIVFSDWTSLIDGSSMPENCSNSRKGGFNVEQENSRDGAKARIGLIARSGEPCNGDPDTKIGFGTSGTNNTCGNEYISNSGEASKVISIKAFCYIFVKQFMGIT